MCNKEYAHEGQALNYDGLIEAKDYVESDGEPDWGALNLFKLANHLKGSSDLLAPISGRWLEFAETLAGGLLAKAELPRAQATS